MTKVGIIGVGHMGTAIIKGLKENPNNEIIAQNPVNPRVNKLAKQIGFTLFTDLNKFLETKPEYVILTTPAAITLKVANDLHNLDDKCIVISAAAGINDDQLHQALPGKTLIRMIPNIPVSVNEGTIGLYVSPKIDESINQQVKTFLSQLGDVISVDEDQLSIVGTIGGCGPAFVDIFLDALADSGVLNGLKRETANQLAASMVQGAASLALKTQKEPALLRDQVCSPGGTTIKGVAALEKNRFRYAVIDAINESNRN